MRELSEQCRVHDYEVLHLIPYDIELAKIAHMDLLKDKGVPITGVIKLRYDTTDYDITATRDSSNRTTTYLWRKKR